MAFDHSAERVSIGWGQADLVPRRHTDDERGMVHREQRRLFWRRGQLGVEPAELITLERA